ncbi:peptidase domain-containing ABC transporter [Brucella pituitosa]|uniref:ATP-binding cassette domain-containing protein n=1 Tax=Brucella pituitosa TaxID=571256 RepID=A0ABS3K773_9HYPH|nr:cysteine peptidase family C39 domain-containing protein [Brucella pituitosa]MBO1042287.1 ATP-binding cassette domain-containing protein [Brucella pituitosa]
MNNQKIKLHRPEMVFQHETGECGLACISMFCSALGSSVELSELRDRFPVTSSGASLMELTEILAQQDIPALAVKFTMKEFENLPLPAILHFGGNHYVFVLERKGNYIRFYNPASGTVIIHSDAVRDSFTGYAVILDRTKYLCKQRTADAVASSKGRSRFLRRQPVPYIKRIFVGSLCVSGLTFVVPMLYSKVLDKGSFPEGWGIFPPFFAVIFAIIISAMMELMITKFAMKQRAQLSSAYLPGLFGQLLQKEMRFFERRPASDINQRLSSLSRVIVNSGQLHNTIAIALLTTLISTLIMCWLHPLLGGLALATILLYGAISLWYGQSREALHHAMENTSTERNDFTYETILSVGLIKSASLFRERCAKFAFKNEKVVSTVNEFQWLNTRQQLSYRVLADMENILMLALAMYLVSKQALSVGGLFAFVMCKQIALAAATEFFMAMISRKEQDIIEQRAQELLTLPATRATTQKTAFTRLEISHLTLSYGAERPVFHLPNLSLLEGEKIALIGLSGSGKSSLMKLLCGWLPLEEGSLVVDGEPTEWTTLQDSAFYQRPEDTLLSASVLENITLFGPPSKNVPAFQLIETLGLKHCIDALPHRHHTHISVTNPLLSAGQQQRLMVARALCCDKPLLLLDEPTANLDKANSQRVIEAIVSSPKTIIVSLHDPDLLVHFDRIIEIKEGNVIVRAHYLQSETLSA